MIGSLSKKCYKLTVQTKNIGLGHKLTPARWSGWVSSFHIDIIKYEDIPSFRNAGTQKSVKICTWIGLRLGQAHVSGQVPHMPMSHRTPNCRNGHAYTLGRSHMCMLSHKRPIVVTDSPVAPQIASCIVFLARWASSPRSCSWPKRRCPSSWGALRRRDSRSEEVRMHRSERVKK